MTGLGQPTSDFWPMGDPAAASEIEFLQRRYEIISEMEQTCATQEMLDEIGQRINDLRIAAEQHQVSLATDAIINNGVNE